MYGSGIIDLGYQSFNIWSVDSYPNGSKPNLLAKSRGMNLPPRNELFDSPLCESCMAWGQSEIQEQQD